MTAAFVALGVGSACVGLTVATAVGEGLCVGAGVAGVGVAGVGVGGVFVGSSKGGILSKSIGVAVVLVVFVVDFVAAADDVSVVGSVEDRDLSGTSQPATLYAPSRQS